MTRAFRPLPAPADRRRRSFLPRPEALEGRQLLSAGMIDPSFSTNGVALTTLSTVTYPDEVAYDVQIQADGKIVAAGYASTAKTSNDFGLARYNANGSLDTSFGAGGKVLTDFGGTRDRATDMAIQAGGKIIAVGISNRNTSTKAGALPNNDFALARYNLNGSLDTTFGAGGKVTTAISTSASADSFFHYADTATAVVIQPDGKILVGGKTSNGSKLDFALVRYNANGTLDTTFGAGGKVVTAIGPGNDDLNGMALQTVIEGGTPTIKIVVAGSVYSGTSTDFALARYNLNGSLDTTFGAGGKVITAISPSRDTANDLVIQPDGKIVLAGTSGGSGDFTLARYFGSDTTISNGSDTTISKAGSLDPTFGASGIATAVSPSHESGNAVALQTDGSLIIAGSRTDGANKQDTALARFHAEGTLDTTFGTEGFVVRSFGSGNGFLGSTNGDDSAYGLAIQSDGRIVTAGYAHNSAQTFAVARFLGDAPAPSGLTAATTAPEGTSPAPLTQQALRPIVREALARWRARGADSRRLAALDVRIADLPGDGLGMTSGSTITLDVDAARHGWFVDPTPGRDGDTFDGMDLLTAVAHEIGHALGYVHAEDGLMQATLATGVRELHRDGGRHDRPSTVVLSRRVEFSAQEGESVLHELATDQVRQGLFRSRRHRRSVGAR